MFDKNALLEYTEGGNALIMSPSNTYYISRYESTFAFILITENDSYYLTDSRYTYEAKKCIKDMKVLECNGSNVYEIIRDLISNDKPLYYDEDISYKEYEELCDEMEAEYDLIPLGDIILSMREVKSDEEIGYITKAQGIAEQALTKLLPSIKEGMTENEVVAILEYHMRALGGDRLSFDTIVAFGTNGATPHAHPGDTKLKNHDFITIDFGTTVHGYHGDMTRTMCLGNPTADMRKVYDIVNDAGKMAIDEVMAGKNTRYLDAIARDYIRDKGYGDYFGHGLGHSVGIDIHEDPRLSPGYDAELVSGNVVTVEPGIYIPDRFGVRIEDIIIVKDNNQIDINNLTRELIIL